MNLCPATEKHAFPPQAPLARFQTARRNRCHPATATTPFLQYRGQAPFLPRLSTHTLSLFPYFSSSAKVDRRRIHHESPAGGRHIAGLSLATAIGRTVNGPIDVRRNANRRQRPCLCRKKFKTAHALPLKSHFKKSLQTLSRLAARLYYKGKDAFRMETSCRRLRGLMNRETHDSSLSACIAVRLPAEMRAALEIIAYKECPRRTTSAAIRRLCREGIKRRVLSGELRVPHKRKTKK